MVTKRDIPAWLPPALLIAMLALLYHRLLAGETLFWGLPTLQFYPWREYAFDQLRAGHLPAWNPYLGGGAPLLANYQTAIFYPPNWLWLVVPGTLAMSLIAVLHIVWAWLGMWQFGGALRFSLWGRATGAFAFAFSGYLIARLGSFPTTNAGAWLPWLFWLALRVLHNRRARDVGWLALAFALQVLSGHAQTTFYGAVGLGLYVLWVALWTMRRDTLRTRGLALALVGAALLLSVLIAAVQMLPTAEYLRESQRSDGLDYDTLTNLSYHPIQLLTLLSPDLFGTPADGSHLTEGLYFEDAAYIGFVPLIAALAAVWAWGRGLRTRKVSPNLHSVPFWALLALVGLFFALGKYNPLFETLVDHVPTFDTFREPVRWLILPVFALAVLAGIGVEQWGRGPRVVFWSRLAGAGGGAMAVMALTGLLAGGFSSTLEVLAWGLVVLGSWMVIAALLTLVQPQPPLVGSPVLWRVVVLVFVAFDLAWLASGLNPTVPASFFDAHPAETRHGRVYWFRDYQHAVTFGTDESDQESGAALEGYFDVGDYRIAVRRRDELRGSLLPNITLLDRIPALSNNDPLLPGYHSAYLDLIEDLGQGSGALLRAAGVGQVLGGVPTGWQSAGGTIAVAPDVPPLAWLVPDAHWLDADTTLEAALRDPAWDPAQTVLLAGSPRTPPAGEVGSPEPGEVALRVDRPDERHFQVITGHAAYLVIAETWYPGWSVTVNSEPATLHRANLTFMAVAVPPGASDVVLRYHLTHWPLAMLITLVAFIFALGLIGGPRILRRVRAWLSR